MGVVGDTHSSQVTTTVPQLYVPLAQRPAAADICHSGGRPGGSGRGHSTRDAHAQSRRGDLPADDDATAGRCRPGGQPDCRRPVSRFRGTRAAARGRRPLRRDRLLGGAPTAGDRLRLALGAAPRSVGRLILSESLRVTAYGVVGGLALAWLLGQAAASVLYGVSPHDPATFGLMTALVFVVALSPRSWPRSPARWASTRPPPSAASSAGARWALSPTADPRRAS